MNREARGSAGIAGLMLVGIPAVEAMFSGAPGLQHLATALMGIGLLTACVVSSRS
jgi:hypothetical protein